MDAFAVFDDGSGAALYAGGRFTTAGAASANSIAKWDGSNWTPLGTGLDSSVLAMTVFDDGTGPALYVGGTFGLAGGVSANHVAKWDGSGWTSLGTGLNDPVYALQVYDDGSGARLYAGGGSSACYVARWDGSSWTAVGTGTPSSSQYVESLTVFDDGSGPALYAGGRFTNIGSVTASLVAKWDGSSWSALGTGMGGGFWSGVKALSVFDDGSGPALIAGGDFAVAGGVSANCIAKWDGSSWSALGLGLQGGIVKGLTVFDDGSGSVLYAGGSFATAGTVSASHIARWDGSAWAPVGDGVGDSVYALAGWDDGSGSALYAGGLDYRTRHIAKWNRVTWSAVGTGNGVDMGTVWDLELYDDGGGPALYAGGTLWSAGGVAANRIARWDGHSWSALGTGVAGGLGSPEVFTLEVFDDGTGPALHVGGDFTTAGGLGANFIARWDGSSWAPLGAGLDGVAHAMAVFDDGTGPALYVGGSFTVAGGSPASCIAKWDGSVWLPLGSGVTGTGWSGDVRAFAVFDDGSGPALFVGGAFTTAGGVGANHVAKWDGSNWSPLGAGMDSSVDALTVYDDRSGPALYAAGFFTTAGGVSANRIAKWDGSSWTSLGVGITAPGATQCFVHALAVFDEDGFGPALYAAGSFSRAEPIAANNIVRWDGSRWSPVGSGITFRNWTGTVETMVLADLDADGAQDLYLGGDFVMAGNVPSENIAEWRGCVHAGVRLCFGDGTSAPCPCGNEGLLGHGCNNAIDSGGARLAEEGRASLTSDSLVLTSSGERLTALSLFFQGDQQIAPVVYGDGLRCTGGHVRRLFVKTAVDGIVSAPDTGDPSISARSATLGDPLFAGATRLYQVQYRDKNPTFCPDPPGNTWNASGAVRIDWAP